MSENTTPTVANPLLQKVRMPGTTFRLPSRGIFYTNQELASDVRDGEVVVYPMRAVDEMIMKTPDMLLNGTALTEVFKHCVPQILKPMELFGNDIDFLMLCLRKVSFGSILEIKHTHSCKNAKQHEYKIDTTKHITSAKNIDPTTINTNYQLVLENEQIVNLRPARYGDILELLMTDQKESTPEELTNSTLKTLSKMIMNVDGIEDSSLIREWLGMLSAGDIHTISTAIEKTSDWGARTVTTIKCADCGEEFNIRTDMNPMSFFT